MLALNLLKQRRHYFGLVSLTIQTPVVLRLHFPVLLMLWSALATNLHLVNVALVFLGSSFPAQDCRSGVPWFLWNWWNVDRALITRAPSVMFQFENRPTCSPCFGSPQTAERIYGITYHISSSPYCSEGIHTLVLPQDITQRSYDPGIS